MSVPKAISMIWHDIDLIQLVKQFYSFYMAAVVGINTRHGHSIDTRHKNQPCVSKLVLYNLLLLLEQV